MRPLLAAPRGLLRGAAFLAGAVAGVSVLTVIVYLLESGADPTEDGEKATWVSVVKLGLAVLLLLLATKKWRGRPRGGGDAPDLPGWMSALETLTPGRSVLAGVGLMGVNPKNIVVVAGAITSIVGATGDTAARVVALVVLVDSVTALVG